MEGNHEIKRHHQTWNIMKTIVKGTYVENNYKILYIKIL